jgi:hypothetical protein
MKELKDKVNALESRMNMLLIKYSTTKVETMKIKSDVPSIVKSEPTKHGSDFDDVTLVYSDKKQISAHKLILLTHNPDFNKKKKECNSLDKLDVTLAFEDAKRVYAHSTILSSSSFCFAVEKPAI